MKPTNSTLLATALLAFTVLASGCGQTPAGSASPSASVSPTPTGTDAPSVSMPAATATPEPTPSPPAATEAPKAPKLYRMNDSYIFKPIDESTEKRVVLLTFDDGPKDETVLGSILDTLDKHGAKAIFFVNGYRVKQNPDLLTLIHERGHAIGNHSWDHINLQQEPEEVIDEQLTRVNDLVEELIGERPRFFRPPHGAGNDYVRAKAKDENMLYMTWSNGSLDWDNSTRDNPALIVKNVMDQLHPGSNILMHELSRTAEALDSLLTQLKEAGYGFIDPDTIDTGF